MGNYPDINDKNFTYDIFRKDEFYSERYKSDKISDRSIDNKKSLNHQTIAQRFFSPHTLYKNGLIFHMMGLGKTCLASLIVEHFSEFRKKQGVLNKRALVFVGSETLEKNWKEEIVNVCTNNKYLASLNEKEILQGENIENISQIKKIRRINFKLSQTYELQKIDTFLNKLPKDEDIEAWNTIQNKYSDRVIIIDEAHSLRNVGGGDSRYNDMFRFLHSLKNTRVILLTGTPVWDKVSEFGGLMNLILPLTEQFPIGNRFINTFYTKAGKIKNVEEIYKKCKGMISFVRGDTIQQIEYGISEPFFKHLKVYPDVMSDFQSKYVRKAKNTIITQQIIKKDTEGVLQTIERNVAGGALSSDARDAANFIYPDGSYGKKGFNKYVLNVVKIGNKTKTTYKLSNELKEAINRDGLEKYSIKFANIIKEIEENPNESVFVYNEFVTNAGAILFSLILKEYGFTKVVNPNIINPDTSSKAKRFAIFTSEQSTTNSSSEIKKIIKYFNDPRNKYGEYLRVIIGSEKVSVGLSFKNIRQFHNTMPHWNLSEPEQAKFRAIRYGGHLALPLNERYIKVYNHCIFNKGLLTKYQISNEDTIDTYIYKIAENKDYQTQQLYRILKEIAFDCPLIYEKNVKSTDVKGSRECNYGECNYICKDYPNELIDKTRDVWKYNIKDIDYSTSALYYPKDIKNEIIKIFNEYFIVRFEQLLDLLSIDELTLLINLNEIIERRILIKDRWGFSTFLKEKGNIYYLDNSYSTDSTPLDNIYIQKPFITQYISLEDMISDILIDKDKDTLLKLCQTKDLKYFKELSQKSQISILEYAYKEGLNFLEDIFIDEIFEMEDGNSVHILYTYEFTGTSYNTIAKNIAITGRMRVFDNNLKDWEFVKSKSIEEEYIAQIKKEINVRRNIGFVDNPYGVYGSISLIDNMFRIHIKEGDKERRGKVCENFKNNELFNIIIDKLQYIPYTKKYTTLSEDKLKDRIKEYYKGDLSKYNRDELRGLYSLTYFKVKDICRIIKKILSDKKILYTL